MYNSTVKCVWFSYPFIELFVRSRDIDMMIHAIKLLNNYALKSSVQLRKVYCLTIDDVCTYDVDTYMALSNSFNYDYFKHKHIYSELSNA
jgi:hypothetical protein